MQVTKIGATPSFGMDIVANESFWATVNEEIWRNPEQKESKKLLKKVTKLSNAPLKDTYEIKKSKNHDYSLYNQTRDLKVLEFDTKKSFLSKIFFKPDSEINIPDVINL